MFGSRASGCFRPDAKALLQPYDERSPVKSTRLYLRATHEEIAELTGRSLRTVERTLQHCRQQLSTFLNSDHEPPAAASHAECPVD